VAAAVAKALERLPADRFESARAFAEALRNPAFTATGTLATRVSRPASSQLSRLLGGALVAVTALAVWGWLRPRPGDGPSVYDVALPDSAPMALAAEAATPYGTAVTSVSVSADGGFAVYPAAEADSVVLWRRNLGDDGAAMIPGTANAYLARVSPDGTRVSFVVGDQVMVASVAGGTVRRLASAGIPTILEWASPTRLLLVHSDGYRLSWLDPEVGEVTTPRTIPRCVDGTWLDEQQRLLCIFNGMASIFDPETGQQVQIRSRNPDGSPGSSVVGSSFRVVDRKYLVYLSTEGDLRATTYDAETHLTGRGVTLLTGVRREAFGAGQFALTATGTLVYVVGTNAEIGRLVRLVRGGTPEPLPIEPGAILRFDLTPDRRWLAVVVQLPQNQELRVHDLRDGQDFTWLKAEYIRHPLWSPDGRRLIVWAQTGDRSVILAGARATAPALDTLLTATAPASLPDVVGYQDERTVLAQDWSASVALRLDLTQQPVRLDTVISDAKFVNLSPDGHRLAFQNAEADRVVISAFPPGAERLQVGSFGVEPLWLSDRQLLFRVGRSWSMVALDPASGETVGSPVPWGQDPRFSDTPGWSNRLSHDGGIIYVQGPAQATAQYLRVIPGWAAKMKAVVDSVNR
jgi:hypothetical protein